MPSSKVRGSIDDLADADPAMLPGVRPGPCGAARRLDGVPGVAGIELNISCPNVGRGGLQSIDAAAAAEVTAAVRRATDLPLLVKLSPNVADIRPIARAIEEAGADALTAINTLSGIAVGPGRTRPLLGNIYGGLSGPAIKPIALRIVYEAAQVVKIPSSARRDRLDDVRISGGRSRRSGRHGDLRGPDPARAPRGCPRRRMWTKGLPKLPGPDRDRTANPDRAAVREGRRIPTLTGLPALDDRGRDAHHEVT
jgi:hypothetical protein